METSSVVIAEDLETKTEQLKGMIASLQKVEAGQVEGIVVGVLTRSDPISDPDAAAEEGMPVDFMAFLMGCPDGIKFTFTKLMECTIGAIKEAQKAEEEKTQLN